MVGKQVKTRKEGAQMSHLTKRTQEKGQTLVEYALILILIAVALIIAYRPLQDAIKVAINKVTTEVNSVVS